ncbi:bifunctional hydroxymethylpyrimidine kinase/phosphomethylpyrimidine kinase [Ruminiclostridium papyrosolvens]|uniref:Hydroxymethylpyrimidine/phosphomethylpyrimidine kinase n=1 Tax=Ruminiclostridium papyrosolvens C7 TaxID=1330534 RepID=U4R5C1_9FIRM|nr:bifunctional hydroxymethylpyrimidine kinase/phosphomethylpyrimidine kinase [Ruminiclostridium papyrosolvens]EPR13127.1 phosphomethylpyrimidine kinase [Ruminiclostridium papyrosolvens C7]
MKKVLTVAGSDCSGGAGVQADLKTFAAHGVYGMSVIVSVVAENTCRVIDIQDITPDMIKKQMDAVFEDITPDAVKIGMLSGRECMEAVAEKLEQYKPINVVIDPVMIAKGGHALMKEEALGFFTKRLIPLAGMLTPNIPETEAITGMEITTPEDMKKAAVSIHQMGAGSVLIKGGHLDGDAEDILFDGREFYIYSTSRIQTKNTHGTGCTFSSAIASNLALRLPFPTAVEKAKEYVTMAIEHSLEIGKGHGPTHHLYGVYKDGLDNWRLL